MKKQFRFEFEDMSAIGRGSKHDGITYEYSDEEDEQLRIETVDGIPFVSGNSSGLLMLAKVLLKIGSCEYRDGFHVHLHEDFNPDSPEVLTLVLNNEVPNNEKPRTASPPQNHH